MRRSTNPTRADSLEILQALGSDPLYVRLCQAQACFRARLTPKPWRCQVQPPPNQYPWENANEEARYRAWERDYLAGSARYAVCRLIKELGPAETHPDVTHDLNRVPWPFPDGHFRQVLAYDVIEHLDDVRATMEEIYRICRHKCDTARL